MVKLFSVRMATLYVTPVIQTFDHWCVHLAESRAPRPFEIVQWSKSVTNLNRARILDVQRLY